MSFRSPARPRVSIGLTVVAQGGVTVEITARVDRVELVVCAEDV
jgi:hypothetical protein